MAGDKPGQQVETTPRSPDFGKRKTIVWGEMPTGGKPDSKVTTPDPNEDNDPDRPKWLDARSPNDLTSALDSQHELVGQSQEVPTRDSSGLSESEISVINRTPETDAAPVDFQEPTKDEYDQWMNDFYGNSDSASGSDAQPKMSQEAYIKNQLSLRRNPRVPYSDITDPYVKEEIDTEYTALAAMYGLNGPKLS